MTLFEKLKEERLHTVEPTVRPSKKHIALCTENTGIQEDVISLRIENEALKAENAKLKEKLKRYYDIVYAK